MSYKKPEIILMPALKILGITGLQEGKEDAMPFLMKELEEMKFMNTLSILTESNTFYYATYNYSFENSGYSAECVLGKQITREIELPDGLTIVDFPERLVAKFHHNGRIEGKESIYEYIFSEWLPESGFEFADVFEIEEFRINPETGESEKGMCICLSIDPVGEQVDYDEPEIVWLDEIHIAGLSLKALPYENASLKMWKKLIESEPVLKSKDKHIWDVNYNIINDSSENVRDFLIGKLIDKDESVPDDLNVIRIPKQQYAKFTLKGHLSKITDLYEYAVLQWIDSSKYKYSGTFELEKYPEDYDVKSDDAEMELFIPIMPARF